MKEKVLHEVRFIETEDGFRIEVKGDKERLKEMGFGPRMGFGPGMGFGRRRHRHPSRHHGRHRKHKFGHGFGPWWGWWGQEWDDAPEEDDIDEKSPQDA